ncbi:Conserved_hypothetical protein [Hexamita inflata]|uniref:EF-hand domain-containing protein n=1 Tax=Hexamita inflata TaxID=28002 RepID=A0AA86Q8U9_9EUKA|nr:Conserved hypothetical protein [Hexamita inflata]
MVMLNSSTDLVKIIDPKDLNDIRALFSGNMIDLETFSRTIRTYVPKMYTETEDMIDQLAGAIVDLFEELDSDADGFITWPDFISYYTEASAIQSNPKTEMPKTQTVFNKIQQSTQQISGKTAKVQLESVLANNAQFTEIAGTSILQVHFFNENYYVITQLGVYQCDSSFLFPKLVFEPTPKMLNQLRDQVVQLDNRTREKLEAQAKRKLEQMDPVKFGRDSKVNLNIRENKKQESDSEDQEDADIIRAMQHSDINQTSPIQCSCLLSPLPLLIVCMKAPLFVVISLQGTQGISDPFKMDSMATSLYWNKNTSTLYVGHISGAISAYKIAMVAKKHKIMQQLEADKPVAQMTSIEKLTKLIAERDQGQGAEEVIRCLSKDDLIYIYPEMKSMMMDIAHDDKSGNVQRVQQLAKSQEEKIMIEKIMKMKAQDHEITHLITGNIFNAHVSTMESHSIKAQSLIMEDPKAYIEASLLPNPMQTAITEKKHGGVQLDIDADLIVSRYIANGAIRKIDGGVGNWEDPMNSNLFRIAVAGGDGSVSIVDENLEIVTCFPELHVEGLVSLHVVNDYITSVGYDYIFQIPPQAIQQSYMGKTIKVSGVTVDLQTSESVHASKASKQRKPTKRKEEIDITEQKLMQGELLKTQTMIKEIPPPRPGRPILSTFIIGNIVGVIDFNYTVTMFHAISGAHVTRATISVPGLIGMKFGECSYNYQKDVGFLPIGKHLFYIKTIPNEDLGDQMELWSYLAQRDREEKQSDEQIEIKQKNLPIGSCCKQFYDMVINQNTQELALITDNYEITFFSLLNGRPSKVIDLEKMASMMSEETGQDVSSLTEYKVIESGDLSQQYTENYQDADKSNVKKIVDEKKKKSTNLMELETQQVKIEEKKKERKSFLPQLLNPINQLQKKHQSNILDIIGNKILSIQTDAKGRILYVIGTRGVITIYWKTGCLFDNSAVGDVGKKLLEENLETSIINPFDNPDKQHKMEKQEQRELNVSTQGSLKCYSLNLDLSQAIVREYKTTHGQSREQFSIYDPIRRFLFLYDTLNNQELRIITTSSAYEYQTAAVNTRILMSINCSAFDSEFDPLHQQRQQLYSYFKNNEFYWNQTIYKGSEYFKPGNNGGFIQRYINIIMNELQLKQDASHSFITQIAVSTELAMLAIATSDGRVLLFDTDSVKFMKQGVIYLPALLQGQPVTCLQFLGSLPMLFIATQDGHCFVYSVRPLIPTETILLSFRHSNYCPMGVPVNVDYQKKYTMFNNYLKYLTRRYAVDSRTISNLQTEENDFIKYIFFSFDPDVKSNQQYFKGADAILHQSIVPKDVDGNVEQSQNKSSTMNNSKANAQQSQNSINKTMSALGNCRVEGFRRGVVTISESRLSISTAGGTEIPEKQGKMNSSQSQQKEIFEQHEQMQNRNMNLLRDIVFKSQTNDKSDINSSRQPQQVVKRKKNSFYKIRAAIDLLLLTRNLFSQSIQSKTQIKINYSEMEQKRKKQNEDSDEDDLLIQSNAPITDKIKQSVKISDKTKRIITDFQKSRFFQKKDTKELEIYDRNLTKADIEEIENEKQGLIFKYEIQNGQRVRIPVRKVALESIRESLEVCCCCFDQQRQLLILGDDQGYVTCYNIAELLKRVGSKPIELKRKKIIDTHSEKEQEIILGFVEQHLNLPDQENNGKLSPLYHAHEVVQIKYSYRAHQSNISKIVQLASQNKQNILTAGEDRRMLVWNIDDCTLQGAFQRVNLDSPPDLWLKLFGTELKRSETLQVKHQSQDKQNQKQQLSLHDLQQTSDDKYLPAPSRYEMPPAANYPWTYKPVQVYAQSGMMMSSSAISSKSTNPVQTAKSVVKQHVPVPVFEQDQARNLLKTTGLTPTLLEKNKDSWTVRAMIGRATAFRVDSQLSNSQNIMSSLQTGRPESDVEED